MSLITKLKNTIVNYFEMYCCMLMPKKNNRIAFGSWMGEKYDDNSRYIYEYMLNNNKYDDYEINWITSDRKIYNKLIKEHKPVLYSEDKQTKQFLKKAKYIFYTTNEIDIGKNNIGYIGGSIIVNLWHGIPIKKIMYDDEHSQLNQKKIKNFIKRVVRLLPYRKTYVISTSEQVSKIYQHAFRVKPSKIIALGQPRNDIFFNEHENPYEKRFSGKKIILYMPTHRNEGKTKIDINKIMDVSYLNSWCERNGYLFVIKKHFYHRDELPIDNTMYNSVIEITSEETDVQELLDAANVLITDYSSCYIDYLLLNRPIIFYNYDIDLYQKNDRGMYFDYDKITPGYKCKDFTEVINYLDCIIKGEDKYKTERDNIRKIFYSNHTQKAVSEDIIDYFIKEKSNKNEHSNK